MADQAHEWTDDEIERLERRFRREYNQASREMRGRLEEFMADFERENEDWLRRVRSGDATQAEYEGWLSDRSTDRTFIGNMSETLARDANNANQLAMDAINDTIPSVFAENANYAAYEVGSATNTLHSFDLYDQDTVRRLIRDQPDLLPPLPNPRIDNGRDLRWNRQKFASAVTQSVLQGESIPRAAKRISNVMRMNERAAVRAARTALTGAENAGRVESYRRAVQMGIEIEQQWEATFDERTRMSHRELHGQHVPVGEAFVAKNTTGNSIMFPGDPTAAPEEVYNCRCTLVAWSPEMEAEEKQLWTDWKNGTTYEEWKAGKKAEKQRKEASGVVDGKNILGTWKRRPDKFDFEIEDVLNAQGFDGKPRVVSAEEFDAAVKAANNGNGFIAQRSYAAPDKETLDAYRQQLYEGKWYVDCSTGGAQYGQGMYCAADYTGNISAGMRQEMGHYRTLSMGRYNQPPASPEQVREAVNDMVAGLGWSEDDTRSAIDFILGGSVDFTAEASERAQAAFERLGYERIAELNPLLDEARNLRASARAYTETLTLDPSARIIDYTELMSGRSEYAESLAVVIRGNAIDENAEYLGEAGVEFARRLAHIDEFDYSRMSELYERMSPEQQELANSIANGYNEEIARARADVLSMNPGSYAAALGYDAINAASHGQSGSYTVVLNRTKLIIREPQ